MLKKKDRRLLKPRRISKRKLRGKKLKPDSLRRLLLKPRESRSKLKNLLPTGRSRPKKLN